MKITLEFSDEDKEDLELCLKARDYYSTLFEFNEYIRRRFKHESFNNITTEALYEEICQRWLDETEGLLS